MIVTHVKFFLIGLLRVSVFALPGTVGIYWLGRLVEHLFPFWNVGSPGILNTCIDGAFGFVGVSLFLLGCYGVYCLGQVDQE